MIAEVYAFLAAILCGAFAVSLWHILEALRDTLNLKGFFNAALDILLWLSVAVVFSVCMWEILSLRIRAFEFLGVILGAFFWHITLGKYINRLFKLIFEIFLKIFQFIFKILLTPWTFLYKILYRRKNTKTQKGKLE